MSNSQAETAGSGSGARSTGSGLSELQGRVLSAVLSTVRTSTSLAAEDIDFQRVSNSEFGPVLDDCNERLLGVMNRLLASATAGSDIQAPQLNEVDDVEMEWSGVIEVIDDLLEKADTCLDEYTGAIKERNPEPLPGAIMQTAPRLSRSTRNAAWRNANILKPQLSFREKVDNLDTSPWKPILTSKPHAIVPLEESIYMFENEHGANEYAHPYQKEIESMEYPKEVYAWMEPRAPEDWNKVPFTWVDTPQALRAMVMDMRGCTEIAVDLEHHDTRTYAGLTCLMQLSTRGSDYIVDTLKLRGQLEPLNEVFANPGVIKVLHGAHMDIIWLQRDLGLYVVGLFDTYHAAQALGFARFSLAFILKEYVDFDADKQYQLADWRIRPLPKELLDYARADTHFLLYCFDHMRNQLVEKSRSNVESVLQRSREVALRRYFREVYDPVSGNGPLGWAGQLVKYRLNRTQEVVFKAVHAWRDRVAREEDESPAFVITRAGLGNLCNIMPTNAKGVLNCLPHNCPIPRKHADELAETIKQALEMASKTVAAESALTAARTTNIFGGINLMSEIQSAEASNFWGELYRSSKWDAAAKATLLEKGEVRLAIPLPELTAAVFVSAETLASRTLEKSIDPGARAEHQYVKDRGDAKEKEIVVIKSLGGGRKRKAQEVELDGSAIPAASDDHSSTNSPNHSPSREGAGRRPEGGGDRGPLRVNAPGARRRSKNPGGQEQRQGRNKASETGISLVDVRDEPPFDPLDYSNAPSVLHDNKNNHKKPGADRKSPGSKKFDPYAKFGEGPKGMRRSQREKGGKSLTFKD